MTLDENIGRLRWYIDSIAAKAGSGSRGPLEVALADHAAATDSLRQIGIELARRYERAGR